MADRGTIEVRLPEGAACEREPDEAWEMPGLKCLVPMQNEGGWHDLFEGHLGRVIVSGGDGEGETGYVTWWGDGQPVLRLDLVDPAPEG